MQEKAMTSFTLFNPYRSCMAHAHNWHRR